MLERQKEEALSHLRSELEAAAAKDKAAALAALESQLTLSFQNEKAAIIADYERQLEELRALLARLRQEHADAMAALRAELEAAMAKALADLEARLKAAHAKEIEALLADAAAKLEAALAALRAEYEAKIAALKAQAERDAAELERLRLDNQRMQAMIADYESQGVFYKKSQRDLQVTLAGCGPLSLNCALTRHPSLLARLRWSCPSAPSSRRCRPSSPSWDASRKRLRPPAHVTTNEKPVMRGLPRRSVWYDCGSMHVPLRA